MLIAMDIDGALSAWPRQVLWLAFVWRKFPTDRVVFLAGYLSPGLNGVEHAALLKECRDRLAVAGDAVAANYDYDVHVCVGSSLAEVAALKAAYCRDHGVSVFIGGSIGCCREVRRLSPDTMALWVHR